MATQYLCAHRRRRPARISAAEVQFSAELRIFLRTLNRTFFRFTDSAEPEPNARELVQFRFEPSSERELTVVLASSRFSVAFAEVSVEAKPGSRDGDAAAPERLSFDVCV